LLVVRGAKRYGFEFEHTSAPEVTKSMRFAVQDLGPARLDIVHIGKETYALDECVRALAFQRLGDELTAL
jgi:hypothetical protein